jgi:HK97 family phage prohead protease
MDASLERAWTHDPADGGRAVQRPKEVRDMVGRIYSWEGLPETCKSCLSSRAFSVIAGEALCGRCRGERQARVLSLDDLDRVVPVERAEPAAGNALTGHTIVFDSWSVDLGGFVERVRPQAVNRLISTNADMFGLWNHEAGKPLGRHSAGTMRYWKDSTGLAVTINPPAWAAGHVESVGRGDVRSMSFGFKTIEDEWYLDGKIAKRDLLDIVVSEASAVAFPAYKATDLVVGLPSYRSIAMLSKLNRTIAAR